MNEYSQTRRRETILEIVRNHSVHSQEELADHLQRKHLRVTQPTLSRDLRELGLVKTASGYATPDAIVPGAGKEQREHRFEQLVREFVLSAEAAVNLVVLKTPPAAAQPVASAVDAAGLDDVAGTIGGDDTIFVAFRTPTAATAFVRRVHSIAGIQPSRRTRR